MVDPATVKIGWTIWTTIRPWRRLKEARNRRRAKKGKPLLPISEEDDKMFPKGTQTYTGIAVLLLTPWLAKYGVSSEETATYIAAAGTVVGGLIAILGRMRAGKP